MKLLTGKVISGEKVGRTLGFPTANLEVGTAPEISPGVYTVIAYLPFFNSENCEHLELANNNPVDLDYHDIKPQTISLEALQVQLPKQYRATPLNNHEPYPGLLHYGPRSTFSEEELQWEVYLYNFDFVIYGELMVVDIKQKLRASMKFDSTSELLGQMHKDKHEGTLYFSRG